MEIPNYDEILSSLLDEFDSRIAPESVERNDGNIIYKFSTAIAKTFERTNAILEATSTPFNPLTCTDEQLDSLAIITQIPRIEGRVSGLEVSITNNGTADWTLHGMFVITFIYQQGDAFFRATVSPRSLSQIDFDWTVKAGESRQLFMTSTDSNGNDLMGAFPVMAQTGLKLEMRAQSISPMDDIVISCEDNSGILGRGAETDAEYRQRLSEIAQKQDSISYMEAEIKSLPTVFDCQLIYNNTNAEVDGIQPYLLAVFVEGEKNNVKIADIITRNCMFETQRVGMDYSAFYNRNRHMTNQNSLIYINGFARTYYDVQITWHSSSNLIDASATEDSIANTVKGAMNKHVRKDYITEAEIYEIAKAMDLEGITVLNADILINGAEEKFLQVPNGNIALINSVLFTRV